MDTLGDAEVLLIARELGFRDVVRLSCVCRWFASVLKDNALWRHMLERGEPNHRNLGDASNTRAHQKAQKHKKAHNQ